MNVQQISEILIEAYDFPEFERLVRYALGIDIDTIISRNDDLTHAVFTVVRWCISHHLIVELIEKAKEDIPGNPKILSLSWRGESGVFAVKKMDESVTLAELGFRIGQLEKSNERLAKLLDGNGKLGIKDQVRDNSRDIASIKESIEKILENQEMRDNPQLLASLSGKIAFGFVFLLITSNLAVIILGVQ